MAKPKLTAEEKAAIETLKTRVNRVQGAVHFNLCDVWHADGTPCTVLEAVAFFHATLDEMGEPALTVH